MQSADGCTRFSNHLSKKKKKNSAQQVQETLFTVQTSQNRCYYMWSEYAIACQNSIKSLLFVFYMKLGHTFFNNGSLFRDHSCLVKHDSFCFWTFTGLKTSRLEETPSNVNALGYVPHFSSLHNQVDRFCGTQASSKISLVLMRCEVWNHPCASSLGTRLHGFSGEKRLERLPCPTRTTVFV